MVVIVIVKGLVAGDHFFAGGMKGSDGRKPKRDNPGGASLVVKGQGLVLLPATRPIPCLQ